MMKSQRVVPTVLFALAIGLPISGIAEDKAPMPQTRGMQGMDPAAHERWEKEGEQDPYKDCKPNADNAARQARHPMPETKGMKGMDPKMHEVDCPSPDIVKPDPAKPPKHVHKGPGS